MKWSSARLHFPAGIVLFLVGLASAQVDTGWVRRWNGGTGSEDAAKGLAVDQHGNVYVTGYSRLQSSRPFASDYATVKYDSAGTLRWVARYNGSYDSADVARAIAIGSDGGIYVTGYTTTSEEGCAYATVKYNPDGGEEWAATYTGLENDAQACAIVADNLGGIAVTGYSWGGSSYADYATIKYNWAGNQLWTAVYNGPADWHDYPRAIATDLAGNVYVTGYSASSNVYPYNYGYLTIKYNANGGEEWGARYDGPGGEDDEAYGVAVDNQGNVYVTGYHVDENGNRDYATVKYNGNGVQQWVATYDGGIGGAGDEARAVAVDNLGNLYVTGGSIGLNGYHDIVTIKYDSSGQCEWVARYDGELYEDLGEAIAVDAAGNVYVTGYSIGRHTDYDYVTLAYNSVGGLMWLARYDGPASHYDRATDIAVDNSASVYVTGLSYGGPQTEYDFATIKFVQFTGAGDAALHSVCRECEVYPNPASRFFAMSLPVSGPDVTVSVFDVAGGLVRQVRTAAHAGSLRVSLDGISAGVYLVLAEAGGREFVGKLTVQ